ncbi:MAG: nicotinate-nucleotide adenylyltransferase [Kiritimatiellae bacterium]|nr:nicotinate-nucleotide adenylyltransferase [Kiritimatiellia bacterium]
MAMDKNVLESKIGILGGTFNPIHRGHLRMAQEAYKKFDLDKVLFVPSYLPPHKSSEDLVNTSHRMTMLERAIKGDSRFEASALELEREGVSYSIDTIKELHGVYPQSELFFIIGSDTLFQLYTWKNIRSLLELCTFITYPRCGFEIDTIIAEVLKLDPPWPEKLKTYMLTENFIEISSRQIRKHVAEGKSIRYLVPIDIENYIHKQNLYRGDLND